MNNEIRTQVAVLGSGPGGYSASFRCADLGLKSILIEQYPTIGGVCLNVGCIPSKILLNFTHLLENIKTLNLYGVNIDKYTIDIQKVHSLKKEIIEKLSKNLYNLSQIRKIKIINGYGKFINANTIRVIDKNHNIVDVVFDYAIIAAGSHSVKLPYVPNNDSRIWNSTDALELKVVPKHLLIIGGGAVGLEIATIYQTLGSEISIIETSNQIIKSADKDIIKKYMICIKNKFKIQLNTKILKIEAKENGIHVSTENKEGKINTQCFDYVLIAAGRAPNGNLLDLHLAKIQVDKNGFIFVDNQMRTNINNIFAVGDIVGHPMLAHKSKYEGHIAAEVISGKKHFFEPKVIPSIAYTIPEIAWVGITEKQAQENNIDYGISIYPWEASGRAIASNHCEGITKLIFDKHSNRIIGGSIVGINAGELLGEISLAIEMGCDVEDIALTIHAHPTLYESIGLAAEVYKGTVTDIL